MEKNYTLDKLRQLLQESEGHKWTIQEVWEVIGVCWDVEDKSVLTLKEAEKFTLLKGLDATSNQKEAAQLLGISEATLIYKMKKHNLWREE